MKAATSTLSKRVIASAFSKNVVEYDRLAWQQKDSAGKLAAHFAALEDGPLLEIGCGTGFLTEEIVRAYPHHVLTSIDLSDKMVSFCRDRFPTVTFQQRDGEEPLKEGTYSAIFSGMCFHWFLDQRKSLANIRKALKPGGKFYFSFPNARSFPEWGFFPLNPFPHEGLFLDAFGNVAFWEEEYRQEYATPLDFLREMKRLGTFAGLSRESRLKQLIKLKKCGTITITTRITIGYCYV